MAPFFVVIKSLGSGLTQEAYNHISFCCLQIVGEVREAVVSRLSTCEDSVCRTMQIRALANAAVPDTLPLLVQTAVESPSADVSEAAIKALRRFNHSLITTEVSL